MGGEGRRHLEVRSMAEINKGEICMGRAQMNYCAWKVYNNFWA